MRAKNEFRFLSTAYDTKLILERVVDGKLMCPEACCGAPVVECTCGPDCPHCNCFMIHKAMKSKGFTNKLLKENLRQHQFFKKGIGSAVKEIFDIPKDDEEGERPYDINDPSTHYVVKTVGGEHGQIRGPVIFQGSLEDIVAKFGDAVDDPNDPNNWFEGELGIGEDAVVVSADPSDDFSSVEAYRAARGIAMPSDEDEEVLQEFGIEDGGIAAEKGAKKLVQKLGIGDEEDRDKNREFADSLWSKDPEDLARRRRAAERVLGKRRNPRPAHLFTKEGSWRAKKDSEDNEGGALQPRVGISGYQHTDAMAKAAAQRALGKIKPYVSTFVGDGGQKLHIVMSNKERPHPDQPPETMYSYDDAKDWWRDNYERLRDE